MLKNTVLSNNLLLSLHSPLLKTEVLLEAIIIILILSKSLTLNLA